MILIGLQLQYIEQLHRSFTCIKMMYIGQIIHCFNIFLRQKFKILRPTSSSIGHKYFQFRTHLIRDKCARIGQERIAFVHIKPFDRIHNTHHACLIQFLFPFRLSIFRQINSIQHIPCTLMHVFIARLYQLFPGTFISFLDPLKDRIHRFLVKSFFSRHMLPPLQ